MCDDIMTTGEIPGNWKECAKPLFAAVESKGDGVTVTCVHVATDDLDRRAS